MYRRPRSMDNGACSMMHIAFSIDHRTCSSLKLNTISVSCAQRVSQWNQCGFLSERQYTYWLYIWTKQQPEITNQLEPRCFKKRTHATLAHSHSTPVLILFEPKCFKKKHTPHKTTHHTQTHWAEMFQKVLTMRLSARSQATRGTRILKTHTHTYSMFRKRGRPNYEKG